MPAPSPPPDDNDRAFSPAELAVARRAYARQMPAASASTIRRSKPPTPPRRVRRFWDRRPTPRPRPSPAAGLCPAGTRLCSTRISHRPRPGARGQQPARRCAPSSSRPSARSPASASSMSAPARAIIARSRPSWSARPARSRRSSSTPRWPSGLRASFPAARTCASSATTALTGPKPRPTGFTSILPFLGRRIAGSRTSHATAG